LVVVDLSTSLASAYTTMVMADYGAEVIQVERPGGSPLRRLAAWPFWLRGKKSIVLDLGDRADVEVAKRLLADADVAVEAFGPGKADRFGLGYDGLGANNPRLVYTSITGFGHTGPYSHLKGYEAVAMAKSGSMYGSVAPGRAGEPVMTVPFGATLGASLLALQGTLLALLERERSGWGQRVDATLVQAMMAFDPWSYIIKMLTERYPDAFTGVGAPTAQSRTPTTWLSFGLMNGYTKDGRWLQFAHATFHQFDAFVRALGLEWARRDPQWKDAANSEDETVRDKWWTMMLEAVRARTVEEWQAVFDGDKDVFAELYRTPQELLEHPQIVHNGADAEVDVPGLGTVREMGPLVKMSETPGTATRVPPRIDEHGDELRRRRPKVVPAPATPPPTGILPLEGVTIVDLGTFYAAPFGSAMLADQGATVIHIEGLDGDPIRFQMPMPEASGVRVLQGKKSVALDMRTEEGRAIATELIRQADMVLHTYRGGAAQRLGLDAGGMRQLNPNLVYHHGVGYGVDGPYARRPAFAPTIAAGSGYARRSAGGGTERADLTLDDIKDATVGMWGVQPGNPDGFGALGVAVGMMLGLYARDRGAGGQETMTTMLSTIGHVMGEAVTQYNGSAGPPQLDAGYYGFSALYRLYQASDAWIVLCAPDEADWAPLVAALPANAGLAGDARFASPADRAKYDRELAEVLSRVFALATAANWEHDLSAADIGCAEVAPAQGALCMGLLADGGVGDQLGLLTRVTHPVFDEHQRATQLVTLSRGTATLGPGCQIGQHTDEILRQYLGYDEERIARLRAEGVIR
jgi:crotonobetainyl-CoA:carnitine CoA-transferase CaiB-like acyl-CoA transferase